MEVNPLKRYSAAQALEHEFLKNCDVGGVVESSTNVNIPDILSQELITMSNQSMGASLSSFVIRKAVLNGKIETIEKFSENNFSSINSLKEGSTLKNSNYSVPSKFSGGSNSNNNIAKNPPKKSNTKKDMHKQAIMKSMLSKGEDYYDNLQNKRKSEDEEKKTK